MTSEAQPYRGVVLHYVPVKLLMVGVVMRKTTQTTVITGAIR